MKRIRMFVNMIALLSIYNLLLLYISWNIWTWTATAFDFSYPYVVSGLIVVFGYSFVLGSASNKLVFLKMLGSVWLGLFQYFILLLPAANVLVWILEFFTLSRETAVLWTGYGAAVALLMIFFYGTYHAYSPVIRKYELRIAKTTNRKTLRIGVASDMHFGALSGKRHLRRLVKCMDEIKPDLILLPGDIVDDDPKEFLNKKMDELMKTMTAPLGIYGVLGNHEYYGKAIPELVKIMERIGITILQDEAVLIDNGIVLIGRKDRTDKERQRMEEITAAVDKTYPVIMMDHQPYELEQAMKSGVDVLLSGHTHRGQLAPNHFITKRIFELDWGYKQKEQLHAVVSSGFGFWGPPMRIGSRSEVVQIDITFS
ncbi:hypothetical protein SAMN05421736_1249 [Evansella caseinilytica]|uniref:Calcineurin-like phosphoesterase domain-containing protein n=1 Tax=Evansella caseinilytica TaxID=1503961 RepID=A0A1H3UQJ2_9BACI|nr:metallophosphoesterase [Evansella caseinilytica]SDZ64155.1 hypothetical protein SAMN05421736_1249 [Evansella caseinilytica]